MGTSAYNNSVHAYIPSYWRVGVTYGIHNNKIDKNYNYCATTHTTPLFQDYEITDTGFMAHFLLLHNTVKKKGQQWTQYI